MSTTRDDLEQRYDFDDDEPAPASAADPAFDAWLRGAAPAMILERTLKHARVASAENENAAFALMKEGKAQGYAQNRFMLRQRAQTLPGARVLDDSFAGLRLAFATPKGRPAAARYVAAFVQEAKASGAVQRAIDAAGIGADVRVASTD